MRKIVIVGLLSALLASIVVASATAAKPKPWQWKPEKVVTKLTAVSPINGGETGGAIISARCVGQGRGVLGRYSRFKCTVNYGGPDAGYAVGMLTIRSLPVGSGKLCVITVPSHHPGEFLAWQPSWSKQPGPRIKPEFSCPSA
jgi:hypothetical protein